MRTLLLTLLVVASAQAAEQVPEFKFDPKSPPALAAKAKYEGYDRDAQALRTAELYKELTRLDAATKSRIMLANKPEELMAAAFNVTDDDMRVISYAAVLQKRGEGGDPYASFFYGARQWDFCLQLQRQTGEGWAKQTKECWQGVMPAFKRAADAQIADAAFNIARLYKMALVLRHLNWLPPSGT